MSVEQLKQAQIQHLRGWESAQKEQQRLACAGASLARKANRASHAPAPELEMQVAENKGAQREVKALVEEERYRYFKISRRLDRVAGWGEVCSVCFLAPDFSCMYMQGVPSVLSLLMQMVFDAVFANCRCIARDHLHRQDGDRGGTDLHARQFHVWRIIHQRYFSSRARFGRAGG